MTRRKAEWKNVKIPRYLQDPETGRYFEVICENYNDGTILLLTYRLTPDSVKKVD